MKEKKSESKRWFKQAEEDLKWVKYLFKEGAYYLVCFLSQQAAEKALKAYLYAQGEEIVTGHSIVKLCQWAGEFEEEFFEKSKKWGILDSYYIPTRYPNGLPDGIPAEVYNRESAELALKLAEEVLSFIKPRIFKTS
jgi:HEPN domain-containing protein